MVNMRKSLIVVLGLLLALSAMPCQARADEYDESQSHPLRIFAYIVFPFGRLLEWTVARPIHALVSGTKEMEYITGHRPHPPLFKPSPTTNVGISKRYSVEGGPPREKIMYREPTAERVTIREVAVVKPVVVEKPVIKEVPKIVEVEKMVFPDVAFRFDSAELTELGRGRVYQAAQKLREKADLVIQIEGHADYVGSEAYNKELGLRRAETVKRELRRLGIGPERISVTSLGESAPIIDQHTDWARAVNRRVEFRVTAR